MQERDDLGEGIGAGWTGEERRATPSTPWGRRRPLVGEGGAETLRTAKAKAARAYDTTVKSTARAYRGARSYAQEHPDVAAAVTFAAGMGIGAMMAGRNGRAYRQGLLPVVAIALAKAVRDVFDEAR